IALRAIVRAKNPHGFVNVSGFFFAGFQVLDFHHRFAAASLCNSNSEHGVAFLRALELLVRFGRCQRVVHGTAGFTQSLHQLQRFGAQRFIFNQAKGVETGIELREQAALVEQLGQHHVPHAEAEAGQIRFAAGNEFDEVVVTTAAGDGAEFALFVERLEDRAGVVSQAANDIIVDLHEVSQTARRKVLEDGVEFGRRFRRGDERFHFLERKAKRLQFGVALRRPFPLQFVDDLIKGVLGGVWGLASGVWGLGSAFRVPRSALDELVPRVAAAEAHDEIVGGQLQRAERIDQQRDQFRVGSRIGLAEDVGIQLEVFAQPAFLLALVAEELRNGEPFDRLFVVARVRSDHAGECRRHFRPQRHGAVAFVGEVVELADDFVAALGGVKLERFERRAVVFAEAIAASDLAPGFKNVIAHVGAPDILVRERFGIKVAKTRQTFHGSIQPQRSAKCTGKKIDTNFTNWRESSAGETPNTDFSQWFVGTGILRASRLKAFRLVAFGPGNKKGACFYQRAPRKIICVRRTDQALGAWAGGCAPSLGVSLSTASRISFPGLNFTTARGGMRTSFAGAFGLRPMRALRTLTSNTPKFRNSTFFP